MTVCDVTNLTFCKLYKYDIQWYVKNMTPCDMLIIMCESDLSLLVNYSLCYETFLIWYSGEKETYLVFLLPAVQYIFKLMYILRNQSIVYKYS